MNLSPIIRMLTTPDFNKVLASCTNHRERMWFMCARIDHGFEFHIDVPGPDGPEPTQSPDEWIADKKRFPDA